MFPEEAKAKEGRRTGRRREKKDKLQPSLHQPNQRVFLHPTTSPSLPR